MAKKLTQDEWVQKAKEKFPWFDYNLVDYKGSDSKVTIICPQHGKFVKTAHSFLRSKCGCSKCATIQRAVSNSDTRESFIEKAKAVHGDYYDYSKVDYIKSEVEVCIICPKHGEFWQTPQSHLRGKDCQLCAHPSTRKSLSQFIEDARKIHGNKYDYSKVKYEKNDTPVIIICPEHGEFSQRSNDHLHGKGCPRCRESHGERIIRSYLNSNNIKYIDQYKINIDKSINETGITKIDFYLPEYNTFIEYNGEQHYMPVEHFGGKLKFENYQVPRDNYVKDYCKENNIKLIEIRYDDDIIKVLNNYF